MRLITIGFDQTMLGHGPGEPGDTRQRHIKYAQALRARYADGSIDVVLGVPPSWSSRQVEIREGLTVHPVPSRRSTFAVRSFVTLHNLFQQRSYDLVTTQTPFDDGFVGVWAKWKFGVPLNVQMRSSFLDMPHWISERPFIYRVFNQLGKWVAHRADTVRVVSNGEKQRLEQRFPNLAGKVDCLHPLVNNGIFDQPINNEELHQVRVELSQRGIGEEPFLLYVGRLVKQKNLPTLFTAFALVNQMMPKSILVLAGDGPLRVGLTQLAQRLNIDNRILWLGNLPLRSLRAWYSAAGATILPSFHEGLAKVIVESYLMGTPVITTPLVCARELIRDGKTGYVAPRFTDGRWLADRALHLLSNPEQAKEMGNRGKEHMRKYLLPEDVYLERLLDIWRDTAERSRGATKRRKELKTVQDSG